LTILQVLADLLEEKSRQEARLSWAMARNMVYDPTIIPCCSPGCTPFPRYASSAVV
jgi:hypothetical protein